MSLFRKVKDKQVGSTKNEKKKKEKISKKAIQHSSLKLDKRNDKKAGGKRKWQ